MKSDFRDAVICSALGVIFFGLSPRLFADFSGTVTLSLTPSMNLDTGVLTNNGADILLSGSVILAQGKASVANFGPMTRGSFTILSEAALAGQYYSGSVVPVSAVANASSPGAAFAIRTNGGHYAKVLVTSFSSGTVTLLYYTYGATGQSGVPAVAQLQNNYSYILPGLPNYGIAPGSLFIIKGVNLNNQPLTALQSTLPPGLPAILNETSVSVVMNGVTFKPGIYYTSPTQLGVVLPSSTPPGTGSLTVTNGAITSKPVEIQVVASAMGFDALYGTGTGPAVATDAAGNLITPVNSASPGQTVILWGSGIGADTSNDDKTYPMNQNDLASTPFQVFIGGIQGSVLYRGRSAFPGVDQVNVTIPLNVPPGCYVSVQALSGIVVSNVVTLPIVSGSGPCIDRALGIGPTQAELLTSQGIVNVAALAVSQTGASASFVRFSGGQFGAYFGIDSLTSESLVSSGGCVLQPPVPPSGEVPDFQRSTLDPGTVLVSGSAHTEVLTLRKNGPWDYSADFANRVYAATGETFTFDNGNGSSSVGHLSASLNFPAPLIWTNISAPAPILRTEGLVISWTGGAPDSYVSIKGSSALLVDGWSLSPTFACAAPANLGRFTVPPQILLALPQGRLTVNIANQTVPQQLTASGIDFGYIVASSPETQSSVTFQLQ
jgi:uncharacterized protein (TIGR03437 family)